MEKNSSSVNRRNFISKSALLGAGIVASPLAFANGKNALDKIEGLKKQLPALRSGCWAHWKYRQLDWVV